MKSKDSTNKGVENGSTGGEVSRPMPESQDLRNVAISLLRESGTNPRKDFDEESLQSLVESVREKGVLVPLLVRPHPLREGDDARLEIVAGARRYRAAKLAKLKELPVIVRELDDQQALEVQVIENLQRADISPLEEAEGYQRLMDAGAYDVIALAKKVGKSKEYIYASIKLRELSAPAKKQLEAGKITKGHAVVIARQPEATQAEFLEMVTDEWDPMTVQQLENEVANRKRAEKNRAEFEANQANQANADKESAKWREKQASADKKYKAEEVKRQAKLKIDAATRGRLFVLAIQRIAKKGFSPVDLTQLAENFFNLHYDEARMCEALGIKAASQKGIVDFVKRGAAHQVCLFGLAAELAETVHYGGSFFNSIVNPRVPKAEQKKIRAAVIESLTPKPKKPEAGSAFAKKFNEKKKAAKAKPAKKSKRK